MTLPNHRYESDRAPGFDRVKLWSPGPDEITREVLFATAACLSAAFSSGIWAETPVPMGDETDPQSAVGIITRLAEDTQLLLAMVDAEHSDPQVVCGCVIGTLLSQATVDAYGLRDYGARTGDALLAYIGLVPRAQQTKVYVSGDDYVIQGTTASSELFDAGRVHSLASLMFATWIRLPAIRTSPQIFIRSRLAIGPILHLAVRHGFQFCGKFDMNFRGQKQDRMVFRRQAV
jgi:hypothetical protein